MGKELLRIAWTDYLNTEIPSVQFDFAIRENEIVGIHVDSDMARNNLITILSQPSAVTGHTVYYKQERVLDHSEWFEKNCFMITEGLALFPQLTIWENLYVNKSHRKPFRKQERIILKDLLQYYQLNGAIAEKRIDDLSVVEQLSIMVLKAKLMNKSIVVIANNIIHFSAKDFIEFLSFLHVMRGHGMTFLIISPFFKVLSNFADRIIRIENGLVTELFHDIDSNDKASVPYAKTKQVLFSPEIYSCSFMGQEFMIKSGEVTTIILEPLISFEQMKEFICISKSNRSNSPQIVYIYNFAEANNLYSSLDIWENLCLMKIVRCPSLIRKNSKKNMEQYCQEILGHGIDGYSIKDLKPQERQRIICHKWLLLNPDIMVCFRPFEGLDLLAIKEIDDMFRIFTERGGSVILFSRSQYQISPYTVRIIEL